MRIGDAAAAAGTTPRALRFYEERGLLPPPVRTASGQREYGTRDVERVRVVRDLLSLGLTVEDLARVAPQLDELAEAARGGDTLCGSRDVPAAGGGVASARLAALDAEIARLSDLRARLAARLEGDQTVG
ncbi:MerR family transcriptional regulator [Actinomadura rupiterrae]|uniref:MerR family transcriptional regulator n=1 Tax=Actinomadura rupiterrae TaxID=559627 RepID=UPI0020A2776C|nr:MerR family transcriptional regulator [Actinomadura rupiterrae]MCP2335849.1 DNA-binding transcriptional MerR regulator [Actinomadura rupiterrae]